VETCAFCEAETDLYFNGVPVCLKCEPDLYQAINKKPLPESPPDSRTQI
jgi:hypothetical protein